MTQTLSFYNLLQIIWTAFKSVRGEMNVSAGLHGKGCLIAETCHCGTDEQAGRLTSPPGEPHRSWDKKNTKNSSLLERR